jgi:hypothetical protein
MRSPVNWIGVYRGSPVTTASCSPSTTAKRGSSPVVNLAMSISRL